jgi:hypothetical protein
MATPFQCLRRFSLRCLNGYAVSMPSAFLASLFEWLRRFNAFGVFRFAV